MPTPDGPIAMSAEFSAQDGGTLAVYGQNVVGSCGLEQTLAGASAILDSLERHLAGVRSASG